jgi:hypothetical protein
MTRELVDFVAEQTVRPLDRWAVAATLESGGIRDVDARERYGRRDVFDLADEVYAQCLEEAEPDERDQARTRTRSRETRLVIQRYLEGGFFFLPLTLQLGSLLILGYGQWASLDFTRMQASVVGVALIASFALTGAFAQTIGYLGPLFASPGRHRLVARIVARIVGLGLAVLLAAAALGWLLNLALGSYPQRLFGAGLVYFSLAGCVSLLSAVLYMLKQYVAMLAATVVGIAVVGLALHHAGLGIYASHWIGLSVTIALEAVWASVVLARRAARTTAELRVARLPPLSALAALVAPYAAYGCMYYALLFVDRLAAWSSGAHGLPFTFRASYEVALDWALISVVPALALLEVVVHEFSAHLIAAGKAHSASEAARHNQELRTFYLRRLALVTSALVVGSALVFAAGRGADHFGVTKLQGMFGDRTTLEVYPIALGGYWLLVIALFSVLFLLTLGRPRLVLRSLWPAIVVAVIAAFVLSRTLPYWTAAGGLAAGMYVFAVLAMRYALRALDAVDYYYYAAY